MGALITAMCTRCDFSRQLRVGGGMNDLDWRSYIGELPEDAQTTLKAAAENGADAFTITRKPCVCTQCGAIYSSVNVSYKIAGRLKRLGDYCPSCGSSRKTFVPEDGSYAPHCPGCGGKVEFKQTGYWD